MAGAVSAMAGNGQKGCADGEGAAARFSGPIAVTADPCSYHCLEHPPPSLVRLPLLIPPHHDCLGHRRRVHPSFAPEARS